MGMFGWEILFPVYFSKHEPEIWSSVTFFVPRNIFDFQIFDFQTGIQQKGVVSLKIHALDCFTWRQCTALGLEGAFISFKATTEHR